MKVVVSIGGSVLAPDLEPERVRAYADVIESLAAERHRLGVVVGGGVVARDYITTARELGANEIQLDQLGIGVTRLNARLLIAALGDQAAPTPPETYEDAGAAFHRGDIPVMGGVAAAQTTDAVSAAVAEYVNADLLVYATSVPGVFSADPNEDPDATRYDSLTPSELVDIIADIGMSAGSNAPVDLLAAKIIERAGLPTIVLDGTDPQRVAAAIRDDEHEGTEIVPPGEKNASVDTDGGTDPDDTTASDERAGSDGSGSGTDPDDAESETAAADAVAESTADDPLDPALYDPYNVGRGGDRAFWVDAVADAIEATDPTDPIIIKGGVSPSGVPHIGHFNEILRSYFVAEVLRERGHEVRQVFTTDDRDPLRKIPRTLADLEWNVVNFGHDQVDSGAVGSSLGQPYTDIDDPFGCCDSYGQHFTNLLVDSANSLDVPIEFISNTDLYEEGVFEDVTRALLADRDHAREVIAKYQATVDDEYVPFTPQCSECGKLTGRVVDVDLEEGTVEYVCEDREAGDRTIDGCGHEGTATFREGKLPWRFEWPAQWTILGVDFEPFGKDHAEGSWPSGTDIALNVLDTTPPVPMVYEWFTLDGEALASSSGEIVTVDEVLELIEPEVLRYFFVKNPRKQRDFSVETLDQLVDEFDRFERIYFGEAEPADEDERELVERAYPLLVDEIDENRVRIPFTFAAVLGMTDDPKLREQMARREGHIPPDAVPSAVNDALDRVEKARAWAERTDNEYNYRLAEDLPDVDFDPATGDALDELADFIEDGHDPGEIQGEIYETAKRHDIDVGDFFAAGYRLFLDTDQGPRLGPFLAALDEEFVLQRLRREG
jgi:lysyl-tRNA synthetase class 1